MHIICHKYMHLKCNQMKFTTGTTRRVIQFDFNGTFFILCNRTFDGVFVFSCCFLDFSVGVWAFVIDCSDLFLSLYRFVQFQYVLHFICTLQNGLTALQFAAKYGHQSTVRRLLEAEDAANEVNGARQRQCKRLYTIIDFC